MKKNYKLLGFLNLVGYIGVITVNILANALPINGITTGEISDSYQNLFAPAGFTFSIWFIIYVLLGVFIVYQLGQSRRKSSKENSFIGKIGYWFFISCLANMAWIFAWHYQIIWLSLIFMIVLLVSLIKIYLNLKIGISSDMKKVKQVVHIPFSVYLGWISVATIANVTTFLVSINWNRFGLSEQFWTTFVIIVGLLLALYFINNRSDIFFGLVVFWAYLGILYKRYTVDGLQYMQILAVTAVSLVIIGIMINKKLHGSGRY